MAQGQVICRMDGRRVVARPGSTILQAARDAGINIPTLCAARDLAPAEACRLCVVEVKGNGRPVAACSTRVVRIEREADVLKHQFSPNSVSITIGI